MLGTFGAATHDEVLQLVVQIAVLLAAARLFGWLAQRFGKPAVVGEILAGVVLGPSLLAGIFPLVEEWIIPQTEVQGHLLEVISLVGVMLLLILTGLETDLALIRRRIGVALGVAVGGLVVPFLSGYALGMALPDDLLADPEQRTVFALFVATALSISAMPVLAKILMDLDLMRREIGQTMLAAGMIDDITGWTLLGLVTALASAGVITAGTVVTTVAMVIVFVAATAVVATQLVSRGMRLVQDRVRGRDMLLTLVIVCAFAWGAFSQALHLEPVIGAFAIGILFGRLARLPTDVALKLEGMTLAVFAPIFFAVVGLKVDVTSILEPRLLLITLLVIAVATFGKVAGVYAGARLLSRQGHWPALSYGAGLNARGAVEIIIATIGLSLGILSQEMFSIIVVMAIATSLMAPIALRFTMSHVEPGVEETRRLAHEEALRGAFTTGIQRVLVPVRPRPERVGTQTIQAAIVRRLAMERSIPTTLFAVATTDRDASPYLARLRDLFGRQSTTTRVVVSNEPVETILREAEAGYDLMVLGAPTMSPLSDELFGPVIDDLVRLAPCPTVVVRGAEVEDGWAPRRILVPTNGKAAARSAADLAFAIARSEAMVAGVHILTPTRRSEMGLDFASDITTELETVGTMLEQHITTAVREAGDVESGILEAIADIGADLLVLGTSVRAGTSRLHLGPRVEYLARLAPCPVVILNT